MAAPVRQWAFLGSLPLPFPHLYSLSTNGTPSGIPSKASSDFSLIYLYQHRHFTMSYSSTRTRSRFSRQKLQDLVNWSARHLMKDEDDVAEYFEHFQSLSDPLIYSKFMTKRECNELFWKGFHCDNRAMLYSHIVDRRPFRKPGADFDFRELFDRIHAIFYQWTLEDEAAEAEAVRRRKLAREEDNQELERLIRGMWERSHCDSTYAVLYRQFARRFPDLPEQFTWLPKPEPLPDRTQDTPLQRTSHKRQVPHSTVTCRPQQHTRSSSADKSSSDDDEQPLLQHQPQAPSQSA